MSSRRVRTVIVSDRDLIFHGLVGLLAAHGDQVEVLDRHHSLAPDAEVHVVVLDAVSCDGPRLVLPTSPAGGGPRSWCWLRTRSAQLETGPGRPAVRAPCSSR